jgi:hypothetical protein
VFTTDWPGRSFWIVQLSAVLLSATFRLPRAGAVVTLM